MARTLPRRGSGQPGRWGAAAACECGAGWGPPGMCDPTRDHGGTASMCRAGRPQPVLPRSGCLPPHRPVRLNTALASTIRRLPLMHAGLRHDAVQVGKFLGGGHPFRGGGVRLHLLWGGRPSDHAGTPVVGGEGSDSHLEDGAPALGRPGDERFHPVELVVSHVARPAGQPASGRKLCGTFPLGTRNRPRGNGGSL